MFKTIMIAPEAKQTPMIILGWILIAVSSDSKYLISPAEDIRPLLSDFFFAMLIILARAS